MTDEYLEPAIVTHSGGPGVVHDLNVSHGQSYAAYSFYGLSKDEGLAVLEAQLRFDESRAPYVALTMPCGEQAVYETKADFPAVTTACTCGDPNHWFVYYLAKTKAKAKPKVARAKKKR
jgi:hypothetical protein